MLRKGRGEGNQESTRKNNPQIFRNYEEFRTNPLEKSSQSKMYKIMKYGGVS